MRLSSPVKALLFASAATLVVGCAGAGGFAPSPAAAPIAVGAPHHIGGASWAVNGLGPQDLLYVGNSNGLVNIYRYWQHNLVGVLTDFTTPTGECADAHENVYITDYGAGTISEYPHGGTKVIRVIDGSPYKPYACAVDRKSGDLAVANYGGAGYYYGYNNGSISIYHNAKGKPAYVGVDGGRFTSLAYDDYVDLLATARSYYYYSFFFETIFYYLPKHGSQLLDMNLPNQYTESGWPAVQTIAYDGQYWVVDSSNQLYRYTINIKATPIDVLKLSDSYCCPQQIAFYRKTPQAIANQVVGGEYNNGNYSAISYWKYPAVGNPYYELTGNLDHPYGVAISRRK